MPKSDQPLTQGEFDSIFSKVARITVELIIETNDGYVLTERWIEPCKGQWHIPGGTVRHGETLHEAVSHVAKDELGVGVKVNSLLGYIEYPLMNADGYSGWPIGIAFSCTIIDGVMRGSEQGEVVKCFKAIPENTIEEQKIFLEKLISDSFV